MKLYIFIVLTLFVVFVFGETTKIVGGQKASISEIPFQVSLQGPNGWHFCGGSIIGEYTVLTAAHCVEDGYKFVVKTGVDNLNQAGEIHQVDKVLIHPDRNSQTQEFDFAIVYLKTPTKQSRALIPLTYFNKGQAKTSGFGYLKENGRVSDDLMSVSIPLVAQSRCEAVYPFLTSSMICAGLVKGGKDSCQGDSGGPLFMEIQKKKYLVGVVSWGDGCARPNKFGVYARVSSAIYWIVGNLK